MVMPQNRVAHVAADEDRTDGYFVVNMRDSVEVASSVELCGGRYIITKLIHSK